MATREEAITVIERYAKRQLFENRENLGDTPPKRPPRQGENLAGASLLAAGKYDHLGPPFDK